MQPWAEWAGAALCVVALGALLEAPRVRDRVLMVDRRRLRAALVRARLRGTPEPLLPFFRDLEEGGAGLVMGAAVSAILFLLFGATVFGFRRLLLGIPLYLGLGLVTMALARLLLLAPRALSLWLLRLAVLATERLLRLLLGERAAPERIPFVYGALLAVWAGAAVGLATAAVRWWREVAV
ncbi:MAG TPA: hypothetical protein VFQ76_12505 [Longimicrobiaceae bacterium]|nr:hypothetical protein [Longimicrobiaceae bacterium]